MIPSIWFLSLILLTLVYQCIASPLSTTSVPVSGELRLEQSPRVTDSSILKRDDDNVRWRLVHYAVGAIIQPQDFGAATMAEFYRLVFEAAMGRWRLQEPPRRHLQIAWHRVGMIMIAQGIDHIPWDVVAEYALGMMRWVNNGHAAFTYDGYFLRPSATLFPHGLYVGLRILGLQQGVNNYLAGGRNGLLDPSLP